MSGKNKSALPLLLVISSLFASLTSADDICFPYQKNLATGWTTLGGKHDDTIRWYRGIDSTARGWADFYIGGLPSAPQSYSKVELRYLQTTANNSACHHHWATNADPTQNPSNQLFDSLDVGFNLGSTAGGTGEIILEFPDWSRWPSYPSTHLVVSWVLDDEGTPGNEGAADGWRWTDPHLVFVP
ncbi:MAG: hypothetical protein ABIK62_00280 [candidate division WOR-3 bacterium]